MEPTLYTVELDTDFDTLFYTVVACTRNDARLRAIAQFEREHGCKPAAWGNSEFNTWVRDFTADGVRCAIHQPQPLTIR